MALADLISDVTTPASMKCRAYASLATTLKLSSDIMRRALQIDDTRLSVTEIPTLTIVKMTQADIEAVQNRLNSDEDEEDLLSDDQLMTA